MTWQENVPRGDLLPLNERPRYQGNWQYIRAEMRDNHYWDEDSDKDGRHKRCDMPNLETDGDITVDANGDPNVIPTSTNGIYYVRKKTAAEAPGGETSEPFYAMKVSGTPDVMHFLQLGFRAMIQFDIGLSPGFVITTQYAHNCSVSRTSPGLYVVTFTIPLPTNSYIPFGTAMRRISGNPSGSNSLFIAPIRSNTKADAFKVTSFTFNTISSSNSIRDASTVCLAIIGG